MNRFNSLRTKLHEMKEKENFHPFKVVMKDGKTYTVADRFWFAFNDVSMVVLPNGGITRYLKFDDVDSLKPVKKRRA
jgi:hypothetical protein